MIEANIKYPPKGRVENIKENPDGTLSPEDPTKPSEVWTEAAPRTGKKGKWIWLMDEGCYVNTATGEQREEKPRGV